MDRKSLSVGDKIVIPSRDLVSWDGDEIIGFNKRVTHQTEKVLFVRELTNPKGVGVSYSMKTPPENSFFVKNEYLKPFIK